MDTQKTIEFLLDTQARHDVQIAEIRELQKESSKEIAEIRHLQKENGEMLSQIIKVVGDMVKVVDQHQLRLDGLN
jgi:hypothetical protein